MLENIKFMNAAKTFLRILIITFLVCLMILGGLYVKKAFKSSLTDSSNIKGCVEVPIIMYHSVLKQESRSGKYVITPWQFESDLKYLIEHGYTTVVMKDIIDYVYSASALPEKPIVLTFDDGCYNNKEYVLPLLEKYNSKAVISIVGEYTDKYTNEPDENPNYAYLSWQNVRDLIAGGRVEIQNHSNDMHRMDNGRMGCYKAPGETNQHYIRALTQDLHTMQQKCEKELGFSPKVFTYPYGSISPESAPVIKDLGFLASLSCTEGTNHITGNKDELYMMKRCIRTNKRDVAKILSDIRE